MWNASSYIRTMRQLSSEVATLHLMCWLTQIMFKGYTALKNLYLTALTALRVASIYMYTHISMHGLFILKPIYKHMKNHVYIYMYIHV
jgi:hypothetical protein